MGEGFAVDFDIGLVKSVDKSAVTHIVQSAGSIDASNPQATELAFFKLAMSKGERHGTFDCLTRYTIGLAPAAKIASGGKHIFFSSAMGCYVVCNSRHFYSPLHSQHSVNSFLIGFHNDGAGAKVTFKFRGFLGLNMCGFGMVAHNLSGAGKLEALGGRTIGFDLRHFMFSLN